PYYSRNRQFPEVSIFFHSSDGATLAAKELIKMDTIFTIAGHGDPQGINDQRLSADNKIWLDDPEIIAQIARESGHIEGQKYYCVHVRLDQQILQRGLQSQQNLP
ncbi:hypothetical protein CHU95_15740, partial [Niveispirillum lacus]